MILDTIKKPSLQVTYPLVTLFRVFKINLHNQNNQKSKNWRDAVCRISAKRLHLNLADLCLISLNKDVNNLPALEP